ncbi:MAG: glutathione S-transferase family protein [Pseudomonadota bacterium]|nr:glutathione S-transferase family protein [Pseudomonadota bacterium]
MLALYHNNMSSCSQKVRLALAEKNLDWQSRHLDLRAGDTQTESYLKLNSKGLVPTLDHDGQIVRESNVILEYLEDVFPEPSIRPADPFGKAEMRLWMKRLDEGHHDLATTSISMGIAFRHQFLARGEDECLKLIEAVPDPVKRERRRDLIFKGLDAPVFYEAIRMWASLMTDMDVALTGREWLAGDAYSIADAAYVPYLTRLDHLNVLGFLDGCDSLAGWYDRVRERPSYKIAILDWNDEKYLRLMAEKGAEAWPKIVEVLGNAG